MRRTFGLFPRVARSVSAQAEHGQNSFAYTPFHEADEIRLLYLSPRNVPNGSIRDAIEHVFLSTAPLYTAVSWMWGALSDLIEFQVDGQTIMIPQNLLRVIEQLRDESQHRRIWIDAICIDQKSLKERNHQVQMMGQIYRNANYVVACLTGKGSSDCNNSGVRPSSCTSYCKKGGTQQAPADTATSSATSISPAVGLFRKSLKPSRFNSAAKAICCRWTSFGMPSTTLH
jgi:hypothetical protein